MLPQRDKQGFLINLDEWSGDLAYEIAKEECITLTDAHWEILHILRDFYQEYAISPTMRIFVKTVKQQLGDDKGNSIHLLSLFPGSPAKIASKIAGLPKPTNCL